MESFSIATPFENCATNRLYQIMWIREVRHKTREKVAEQLICTEHLLDVRPHFCQVGQDIQCNPAPFLEGQRLCLHNTTRCEAPFEEFELGFTSLGVASIVPRLWIMQTVKSGIIVCCHEVCRLLDNECLVHRCFNSPFIFTFCSKHLLHPLSCEAPTILHGPPQSCLGREMQNHMLHRIKETRWEDHL